MASNCCLTHLKSLVSIPCRSAAWGGVCPADSRVVNTITLSANLHGASVASLQGMTLAKEIRDQERGGRTYVGVVDGEKEGDSPQLMAIMNHVLGPRRELKAAISDSVVEPAAKAALKLYQ